MRPNVLLLCAKKFSPKHALFPEKHWTSWRKSSFGFECGKGNKLKRKIKILENKNFKAWAMGFTGKNITTAIMDDGVDYMHPDIKNNFVSRLITHYNQGLIVLVETHIF